MAPTVVDDRGSGNHTSDENKLDDSAIQFDQMCIIDALNRTRMQQVIIHNVYMTCEVRVGQFTQDVCAWAFHYWI